jgi:hypothetical protein
MLHWTESPTLQWKRRVKPGVIFIDLTGGLNGTAIESFDIINNRDINFSLLQHHT